MAVAVAVALAAYNNALNLWPPFRERLYLPCNLSLSAILLALALGPMGLDAQALGLAKPWGAGLGLGAALGAAVAIPLFLAALHPRSAAWIADRRVAGMSGQRVLYNVALRIPLGTALLEELAFRGVLFAAWRGGGGLRAALISSVVFGIWHITPSANMVRANRPDASRAVLGAAIATTVLVTTAAGLALVWIRLASGGLPAPFALHATVNCVAMVAARLAGMKIAARLTPERRA